MDRRTSTIDDTTASGTYTNRLIELESAWWKRLLHVQAPYHWNLRRVVRGAVLDVGCGVGRHLRALPKGSVGIDHNAESIRQCVSRGLRAFLPDDFKLSFAAPSFDTLLFSHVLEHMTFEAAVALVAEYLPYLKDAGRVVLITPQGRGFKSDPTHVEPFELPKLKAVNARLGLKTIRQYSFPLPALFGEVFTHNEFVSVAEK
jgi:SAM-dependent methyltransferase